MSLAGLGLVSAEQVVVDYLDGKVEVQTKANSWKTIDIGSTLDSDSTLRITEGGLAELRAGTLKIHLSKDGTYQLAKTLAGAKQKPDSKVLGLNDTQIAILLGTKSHVGVNVANMGARGAAKGDDEGLSWAGDDQGTAAQDPLDVIRFQMDAKDWKAALETTNKALEARSANLKDLLFDKALILSNLGLAAGSIKALRDGDFQVNDPQYFSAALLVGSQGLETEDYDLVLSKTAQAVQSNPETGVKQTLLLSQALAWKGKGDVAKSKSVLNDVVSLAPQSATGKEASRLLED